MSEETKAVRVIRLFRLKGDQDIKAFADVLINEAIQLSGVKYVENKNGTVNVFLPSHMCKGKWYPSVKIMDKKLYEQIMDAVIEAYEEGQ